MLARSISAGVAHSARRSSVPTATLTARCSAVSFFSLSTVRLNAAKTSNGASLHSAIKRWASSSADQSNNSFITKPLEGPISPHFSIYRFPLPAITSGAHRGTGFALTLGSFLRPRFAFHSPSTSLFHSPFLSHLFQITCDYILVNFCQTLLGCFSWTLTGVLLIRFFSCRLVFGFMGVVSLFSPDAFPAFIEMLKGSGPLLPVLKGLLGFPIAYHFWAGTRHLYWDATGNGLEDSETVDRSCYIVIGLAAASTVLLALL